MNCFNHHHEVALGICKNCHKGICKECLSDVGDGIACNPSCVEEVKNINAMIRKNKRTQATTTGSWNSAGLLYLSMGILFLLTPLLWLKRFDPFLIGMGTLFTIYALYTFTKAKSIKDPLDEL